MNTTKGLQKEMLPITGTEKAMTHNSMEQMRLASLIDDYALANAWTEKAEKDEASGISLLKSSIECNGQPFALTLEGDEKRHRITMSITPPFRVITGKLVDACLLVNFINENHSHFGKITVDDEGVLLYHDSIYLKGINLEHRLIENRLGSAFYLFDIYAVNLAAVALTSKTYEAIRSDYA